MFDDYKERNCGKLGIHPDHPHHRIKMKFCIVGDLWGVVVSFKFRQNRSRGSGMWESKFALFHYLGRWLIQQLVLPYKP